MWRYHRCMEIIETTTTRPILTECSFDHRPGHYMHHRELCTGEYVDVHAGIQDGCDTDLRLHFTDYATYDYWADVTADDITDLEN